MGRAFPRQSRTEFPPGVAGQLPGRRPGRPQTTPAGEQVTQTFQRDRGRPGLPTLKEDLQSKEVLR
jgi:hypothetical protein